MYACDLTGLDTYALATVLPVIHPGSGGHRSNTAHCPRCADSLLDFLHNEQLMLRCERCGLLWVTGWGPHAPTNHAKVLERIVAADLIIPVAEVAA